MDSNRHFRRKREREWRCAQPAPLPSVGRLLFVVLALLALGIQVLVVQPHIHVVQSGVLAQTLKLASAASDGNSGTLSDRSTPMPRDNYPTREDPANCPICQETVHSGQYVANAAVLAALPVSTSVHVIEFDEALPSFIAVSHTWQGRGPPRV